jgi:hypothetical protein
VSEPDDCPLGGDWELPDAPTDEDIDWLSDGELDSREFE